MDGISWLRSAPPSVGGDYEELVICYFQVMKESGLKNVSRDQAGDTKNDLPDGFE
jgi:hypothetical protein